MHTYSTRQALACHTIAIVVKNVIFYLSIKHAFYVLKSYV